MHNALNIGKVILKNRKEKHVTQDVLAQHMGVSKASISKWELGKSFPDIVLLPVLATYFDITVDDLLCYEPQLSKEQIKEIYIMYTQRFVLEDAKVLIEEIYDIIKKYKTCFPLQLMMGLLLMNHLNLLSETSQQEVVLKNISEIFHRVSNESTDTTLRAQALYYEAGCKILHEKPQETIDLLAVTMQQFFETEPLLAQAYETIGNHDKAIETIQIGMYKSVTSLIRNMQMYAEIIKEDENAKKETQRRIEVILESFDVIHLNAQLVGSTYLLIAYDYGNKKDIEQTLYYLQKTVDIIVGNMFPLSLHGDAYFTKIDAWLDAFPLGTYAPVNEELVKQTVIASITSAEAFNFLHDNEVFKEICTKIMTI